MTDRSKSHGRWSMQPDYWMSARSFVHFGDTFVDAYVAVKALEY